MIVAESIGFAATHSMTEILGAIDGIDVSHGSQHFLDKSPVGQGSQSPEDFVASMMQAKTRGRHPIAVHTLFHPQAMKPAVEAAGGTYWLLVRDPIAQIESCYAWIARQSLAGSAAHFLQVINTSIAALPPAGVQASLPNALYYFAVNHVLSYNFLAVGLGAPTRRMEDLMSDETAFREAFALSDDQPLPHFAGEKVHRASHRAHRELVALAAPERDTIRDRFTLSFGGREYRLADMQMLLGY